MRKTLFLLVDLVAARTLVLSKMENAVASVPGASTESKDSTSHEGATSFLKSAGADSIDAAKLVVEKMQVERLEPGSLASLNQAIDTIVGETTARSALDHSGPTTRRIGRSVCGCFDVAGARHCSRRSSDYHLCAQTDCTNSPDCDPNQELSIRLWSYRTRPSCRDCACTNNAKGDVDADLRAFEEALRDLNFKNLAATDAAGDLVTAKDRAYCQAKDSDDLVVTDVTTNLATQLRKSPMSSTSRC